MGKVKNNPKIKKKPFFEKKTKLKKNEIKEINQ